MLEKEMGIGWLDLPLDRGNSKKNLSDRIKRHTSVPVINSLSQSIALRK